MNFEKVKPEKIKWPLLQSEKLDGCYCLALKLNGAVTIYSRTGEVYKSMKHIESLLKDLIDNEDIIIYEAYIRGLGQEKISGYCRDTKNQHPELSGACHQYLTLSEFLSEKGDVTAEESYEIIKTILQEDISTLYPIFGFLSLIFITQCIIFYIKHNKRD